MKAALTACGVAVLAAAPAAGQTTTFRGIAECTHHAAVQFRRHDPGFRRFLIDRASVVEDKFADRVGNQFVSTVYSGTATYEAANGPKHVRFLCLHGGVGKGPVFVYTLPD
ncbi:MAG: hypothetical protein QOD40_1116 [Alphaproteobacteria bacterium]|jgi:hypothetical protein|nr:hypothetical protein [Alphaproteobacteria bacterium]